MWGLEHYPYAEHLRVGLECMLPSSDIEVEVAGLSGDQVQGQYLNRIKAKCSATKERSYDWIIIMGGTNDLGWGLGPELIYEGLSRHCFRLLLFLYPSSTNITISPHHPDHPK